MSMMIAPSSSEPMLRSETGANPNHNDPHTDDDTMLASEGKFATIGRSETVKKHRRPLLRTKSKSFCGKDSPREGDAVLKCTFKEFIESGMRQEVK